MHGLIAWSLVLIWIACIRHASSRRAVGRREQTDISMPGISTCEANAGEAESNEWGDEEDESAETTEVGHSNLKDGTEDFPWSEGPVRFPVSERHLVGTGVSAQAILQEHLTWASDTSKKHFGGDTLGYVTPWHGRGYDFARTFRSKFTYISPVWYQLAGETEGTSSTEESYRFRLKGGHDYDKDWVRDVRDGVSAGDVSNEVNDSGSSGTTQILPRVILQMLGKMRLSRRHLDTMADFLAEEAIDKGYHGYVLDVPLTEGIEAFLEAVVSAGEARSINLLIIQSVRPGARFSERQLEKVVPLVHRFSLMTYDYDGGGVGVGGVPNSPYSWVKECVMALAPEGRDDLRQKILLGIPFYGYDNGKAINYADAVKLLNGENSGSGRETPSIDWDQSSREHVMSYRAPEGDVRIATYPTLQFIKERLQLATDLGVGIAVWELGQGMPYFYDLL